MWERRLTSLGDGVIMNLGSDLIIRAQTTLAGSFSMSVMTVFSRLDHQTAY